MVIGLGKWRQRKGLTGRGLDGPMQDTVRDWIPSPHETEHYIREQRDNDECRSTDFMEYTINCDSRWFDNSCVVIICSLDHLPHSTHARPSGKNRLVWSMVQWREACFLGHNGSPPRASLHLLHTEHTAHSWQLHPSRTTPNSRPALLPATYTIISSGKNPTLVIINWFWLKTIASKWHWTLSGDPARVITIVN